MPNQAVGSGCATLPTVIQRVLVFVYTKGSRQIGTVYPFTSPKQTGKLQTKWS